MTQRDPEPLLRVQELSLAFGGLHALRGVSLDIPRGNIVAMIGPNGAGKTTLFNCIAGIYRPDSGQIQFAGQSVIGLDPDQIANLGLARTFQNIELFSRMTALENVLLGRHRHFKIGPLGATLFSRRAREEEVAQRRHAEEILDFLNLQHARDRFVGKLPYGARKKVELARALALDPSLLLLDEPSAGMNAEEKEDLVNILRDIRDDKGITIALVEHDISLVVAISDHIIVLDQGNNLAQGTPAEVVRNPDVLRAYLGSDVTPSNSQSAHLPVEDRT